MSSLTSISRLSCKLNKRILIGRSSGLENNVRIIPRLISTSKKKKDPITQKLVDANVIENRKEIIPFPRPEIPKNWISHGYSEDDIVEDKTYTHIIFFCTITMCVVGGFYIIMYQPDHRMRDWYKREALLELRRREAEGLPLVDKDFVPAHTIELPTDEELGDIQINI